MKIGINGTCFNGRPSGAAQRFRGLYAEALSLAPSDEFILYEPVDADLRVEETR